MLPTSSQACHEDDTEIVLILRGLADLIFCLADGRVATRRVSLSFFEARARLFPILKCPALSSRVPSPLHYKALFFNFPLFITFTLSGVIQTTIQ
jgi:hypothetical protein